ncbi:MAG: hypothetical protein KBB71_08490 [Lentimicrobiaceae bacterium]|nr:hypothetical protein [Lentimicrobiaceae bacterium]
MIQGKRWIGIILVMILSVSCGSQKTRWQSIDIRDIPGPDLTIHRYEEALFSADTNRLASAIHDLMGTYAVFLGSAPADSMGILQLRQYVRDPFIRQLYDETRSLYPDLKVQEQQLNEIFRYYSYYFPDQAIPQVYTYVSGIDYQNPVMFQPPDLLIALDMYLGEDYEHYRQLGVPAYRIRNFSKEFLIRDCVQELAAYHMKDLYPGDDVLEKMVVEGKKLYFLDALLPFEEDTVKIGFTDDQLRWCIENESNLWKFMIENEVLYSTDIQIINKFFNDGPFTRGFPGSPARLGSWLGWQIIRNYMDHHSGLTLRDLLHETDAHEILRDSGYKPEKN